LASTGASTLVWDEVASVLVDVYDAQTLRISVTVFWPMPGHFNNSESAT